MIWWPLGLTHHSCIQGTQWHRLRKLMSNASRKKDMGLVTVSQSQKKQPMQKSTWWQSVEEKRKNIEKTVCRNTISWQFLDLPETKIRKSAILQINCNPRPKGWPGMTGFFSFFVCQGTKYHKIKHEDIHPCGCSLYHLRFGRGLTQIDPSHWPKRFSGSPKNNGSNGSRKMDLKFLISW